MWKTFSVTATMAVALLTPTLGVAQDAQVSQKSVPEQTVDAFNGVFGVHPGARATHAKGVVLEGTFTPTASATTVSKAAHLQKKKTPVPVTMRFSASTGLPTIPDTDPGAIPRGMAVKFHLPDGSKTDIVVHSFNGFPVATADEFRDLLLAIAATRPEAPKPTALDQFLSSHPAAKAFRGDSEAGTGELRHPDLFRGEFVQVHERKGGCHVRSIPTPARCRRALPDQGAARDDGARLSDH